MTAAPLTPRSERRDPARIAAGVLLALVFALVAAVAQATALVHVVSNGWHAGLVVPREALAELAPPEAADLPPAPYLEFGWGDRAYYPNPRPSIADAIGAGLAPGPAVLHLAPRAAPPAPREGVEVVALALDAPGLAALAAALDASFERPASGRAAPLAPGLYADSLFYPAVGRFHLLSTCNTWVARMLAAAGLAVSPAGVVTADDLMERLRPLAEAGEGGISAPAR